MARRERGNDNHFGAPERTRRARHLQDTHKQEEGQYPVRMHRLSDEQKVLPAVL